MEKMNVGADESRSPLTQNGITLIALIITIIVMLILVGVTINVALNGGLIEKAKTASDQTQRQVSKEQLISAMVGAYDRNGNFVPKDVDLPEGAKWCSDEEVEAGTGYKDIEQDQSTPTNWVITENGNIFYVDSNGTVLDEKPEVSIDNLIPETTELSNAYNNGNGNYYFAKSIGSGATGDGHIHYQEIETPLGVCRRILIVVNDLDLQWFCGDISASIYSSMSGTSVEANKWYTYTSTSTLTLYTNNDCPISESTFDEVYSESYLNRVIASF